MVAFRMAAFRHQDLRAADRKMFRLWLFIGLSLFRIDGAWAQVTVYSTYCSLSLVTSKRFSLPSRLIWVQQLAPTGSSTTNIVSDSTAVLTIVQPMSYISCDGKFTNTLEAWAYVGGPNNIVSGNSIVFTAGPYATTYQTTTFTLTFPTVTLDNISPTVIIWNVSLSLKYNDTDVGAPDFGNGKRRSWFCK